MFMSTKFFFYQFPTFIALRITIVHDLSSFFPGGFFFSPHKVHQPYILQTRAFFASLVSDVVGINVQNYTSYLLLVVKCFLNGSLIFYTTHQHILYLEEFFVGYPETHKFLWSCRVGFIFTLGIVGLLTFGRERPMVKVVSIQSLVMSFLAIFKMDGDMATFFVLMSMGQGLSAIASLLTLLFPD